MCPSTRSCVSDHVYIAHIPCITQVTFEFIDETLLVDNRGLILVLLKLLLELRACKHWLDSDVQLGT